MNDNKLISELLWIQESIICRTIPDATQSLSLVIQALHANNNQDRKLLSAKLNATFSALKAGSTLRASTLLATVIDQEMTAYIKWRARHTTTHTIRNIAQVKLHPALNRINNLLFDNHRDAEPRTPAQARR